MKEFETKKQEINQALDEVLEDIAVLITNITKVRENIESIKSLEEFESSDLDLEDGLKHIQLF